MKVIENFPLQNEYEEYLEIVKTIPEDSKIEIEYYPDIARDLKAKALEKLSADNSVEEIANGLKKAAVVKYSERHHKLLQKGFSMNIVELFEKIDKQEEYSEELLKQIGSYALVPEDIRKNVIISPSLNGYYYGGRFTDFN